MTDAAVTMDFHPQPTAGEARPWAFPAPERSTLDNGLTVLRCDRPGQQVVAVEINLDAPLDAAGARVEGRTTPKRGGGAAGSRPTTATRRAASGPALV
ncbi:insulinase family protein, partial [Streptomyces sp. NPDC059134]